MRSVDVDKIIDFRNEWERHFDYKNIRKVPSFLVGIWTVKEIVESLPTLEIVKHGNGLLMMISILLPLGVTNVQSAVSGITISIITILIVGRKWVASNSESGDNLMSKNLISLIAKELGVDVGEEFKLKGYSHSKYRFANDRLEISVVDNIWGVSAMTFNDFKDMEVVKLSCEPKEGD